MPAEVSAPLDAVRAAIGRHDWEAARTEALAADVAGEPLAEAHRLDLLADASWWLGHLDECTDAREQAYRAYEELGERRRAGQCAVWLYEHHAFRARGAIAGGWLRRARRALGDDPDCVEHGALVLRELEARHGAGQLEQALGMGRAMVELGRRLRSADLEAEALQAVGRVLIDSGELAEGMGHLDEAMLFAVEGRLGPYSTGKVYCSLIGACEDVGDFDRAAEWTEATQRWSERHPFAIFPGICRVHRAIVLKRRGSLAEAEREAARACDELLHSRPVTSAAAWAEVGDICRRLGQLERAEAAFARAQEIGGSPCAALALLRLAQGRIQAAQATIGGCVSGATNPLGRATLLPAVVQVNVAAGDLPAAEAAVTELDGIAAAFDVPTVHAVALVARGRLELARGDAAGARATLRAALDLWRELDVPYEAATAETLLGQALRECGDDVGAAAAFTTAVEVFQRIGAHLDADQVEGAGGDVRRSLPAGLTEREAEVLRLVATGLTNNEVASQLFLSAKTVSRHLSNIFTKIAVSSRSAATAYAFEHDLVPPRPER
jgi:ATP/maltotriose-dependent transcriptional regulator MalT